MVMTTKIGQLAQELSRLNPWWRDPNWAVVDPDLRDASSGGLDYRSGVLADLKPGCLYILRGPRRVGKTVALKQLVEDLIAAGAPVTSIIRVAADGWAAKEIHTVVQNTAIPPLPIGHHRIWLFDEISAVSGDWDLQLKWLRDNDVEFRIATVVLTGSNASALTAAAGTLAGRRGRGTELDRTLLPIGFRSFVTLVSEHPPPLSNQIQLSQLRSMVGRDAYHVALPWLDDLVALWERYIGHGGFPRSVAAARQGMPIPNDFVEDIFNVVAGDAFRQSRLSVNVEMALLERLWLGIGSPMNLAQVGNDLGVSAEVVTRHVSYLSDSYLSWSCPQLADHNWLAKPKAQNKLYAVDPLLARLAYLRNPMRADIDPTVLTEMQIGMAVRRATITFDPHVMSDDYLFYERTATRKEIDFVASGLNDVAIEVKYSEDGRWRGEAATVKASRWQGLVCTRNVFDVSLDDVWAVPAAIFAWLVDT